MKVKELLSDPKRWTKEYYARDNKGDCVADPRSQDAVCWCLAGAIMKCYPDNTTNEQTEAYKKLIRGIRARIKNGRIINFNDDATHEQIVELLNEVDI